MRIKLLPYVTVEVDDRLRRRLRARGERLRLNVRAYLCSAADDVDTAGDKVRDLCDAAVTRVDDAVAKVNDKLDPTARRRAGHSTRSQLTAPPLRCRRRVHVDGAVTQPMKGCRGRWWPRGSSSSSRCALPCSWPSASSSVSAPPSTCHRTRASAPSCSPRCCGARSGGQAPPRRWPVMRFQALALIKGSLILVQPLLVSALLFALPMSARMAGRRVTRGEWLWAGVLTDGPRGVRAARPARSIRSTRRR